MDEACKMFWTNGISYYVIVKRFIGLLIVI